MNERLPSPRDAARLVQLRSLRVQRAREAFTAASAAVLDAEHALQDRQRSIERIRREIDALGQSVMQGFDGQLPRWSQQLVLQRDKLADRLERAEYALTGDERRLEEAQEAAAQAQAELTRALARDDAVRGLLHESRRAVDKLREQRAEREQDDLRVRAR
jgi:ATP-dependent exoDNAse (exonuclease V) beta subunit